MSTGYNIGGGKVWTDADHTSEREPGSWTNCVPCSLVMLARANLASPPSTNAEAQALRKQAGYPDHGPTSLRGFRAVFRVRYGFFYQIAQPADPFSILRPGWSCSMTGSMAAFPNGHNLRRWDAAFAGVHQWFVTHRPDGSILIDDPLAPEGIGYRGQFVTPAQVRAFYNHAGASRGIGYLETGKPALPDPVPPLPEPPPPAPVSLPEPVTFTQAELDAAVAAAVESTKASAHIVFEVVP
jgi:hypothetical protein